MVFHNFQPPCETGIKQILDLIVDHIVRNESCELTVDHHILNDSVDQNENNTNNSDETEDNLENVCCSETDVLADLLEKEKQPKLAMPQIVNEYQHSSYGTVSEVKNVFAKALQLLPCNDNFNISAQNKSASLELSSAVRERPNDSVDSQTVPLGREPEIVHFNSPIAVFYEYSESPFQSSESTQLLLDEEPEGFNENRKNLTFVQGDEVEDTEKTKEEGKKFEEPIDEDTSEVLYLQKDNSGITGISDKGTNPVNSSLKASIQIDDGQNTGVIAKTTTDMVDENEKLHQQVIFDAEKTIQRDWRKNTEASSEFTSNILGKNENYHEKITNDIDGVGALKLLPKLCKETSSVSTDVINEDDLFHDSDVYSRAFCDGTGVVLANRSYNNMRSFIPLQEVFCRAPDIQSGLDRSPDLFMEAAPMLSTEHSEIKSEVHMFSHSECALTLKITDTVEITEYKCGTALIREDVSPEDGIDHVKNKSQKMAEPVSEGTPVENQHATSRSLNALSEVHSKENSVECIELLNEGSKRTENINEGTRKKKRKLLHSRQENECPASKTIKFGDLKQFDPTSITLQHPSQLRMLACKALDHAEENVLWSNLIPASSTNAFNGIRINQEKQTNSDMSQAVYQNTHIMQEIRETYNSVVLDGHLSANKTFEIYPDDVSPKVSEDCCNDVRQLLDINENKLLPSEAKAWIQTEQVNYPGFITATDHLSQTSQGSSIGFVFDGALNEVETPCNSQASVKSINYVCEIQAIQDENVNNMLLSEVAEEVDTPVIDEARNAKKRDIVMNNSRADLDLDFSELDHYIDESIDQIVPNDGIERTDTGPCDSECESNAKMYACDMDMYDEKDRPLCKQIEKTGQADVTNKSCFEWRYAPSCDLDSSIVSSSPELDLEDQVVKIIPLKTSRKPLRLGLSRKQSLVHLHKPKESITQ